ncbi:capsule assembly Wzi family protein [Algoriphagus sp. D3-2-R+10]|uniref:capsule assembly Wzi family protein n=1 Tax=Algoriphagus aurantiacus TaxID=3103948 RepID=UPI002B3DCEC3|nr:capsule assembly Wzi family protein [Algoriphagus sp. D3-2-R+10]MEB2777510.1 capsule assembly Wzi family protein [Algoriphagus sp. D3-2-R+10]
MQAKAMRVGKRMKLWGRNALLILLSLISESALSQILNADDPVLEEFIRRKQLLGEFDSAFSFQIRPFYLAAVDSTPAVRDVVNYLSGRKPLRKKHVQFSLLPLRLRTEVNSKRPYGWGNKLMVPNVGIQTTLSAGFYTRFHVLEIQFQPEYLFAQNKPYQGFGEDFTSKEISARFFYWNNGDNPERFGAGAISKFWWGQSSANIVTGPIALGISTQNIWWGPGQFNSLVFSDNAQGFPHLSLATRKPLRTFMGNFEGQIIVGRLENSGLAPSQIERFNDLLFRKFDGDWRYLNGISLTYNPSFIPHLFVGFNRTFQQYSKYKGDTFAEWFPIFEGFQKEKFFTNGNSVIYDSNGRDQQVSIFFRLLVPKAHFEIYGEYGRRDHSFNWREFILNPEHARAYLAGFQKIFPIDAENTFIQVRGEMTHQSESVNRYIRYPGLIGNQTWHTHGLARGFVNYGETLGVGSGVGSNVQILEVSHVSGFNKRGILLERLENNQDFYYRAFGHDSNKKPWIDFSVGLLWDQQWDQLILSGKAQFIKSYNYQWVTELKSKDDFPVGYNPLAFYGSLNLIYSIR